MSEVVGYLLTFAIISAVLLIAMMTFGSANHQAEQRVLEVEAASVAHRVAAAVVDADLFANSRTGSSPGLSALDLDLGLPASFGNDGYTVELCLSTATTAAQGACGTACQGGITSAMDTVRVTTRGATATENLLGARGGRSCVSSGRIHLQLTSPGPTYLLSLVST